MHCEGAELGTEPEALRKIRRLCFEYHEGSPPCSHQKIVGRLRELDFEVRTWPSTIHAHLGLLYAQR